MAITEEIEITKLTNMNDELFDMAKKGEWDKVVDIYRTIPEAQTAKFSNSGDTALHIAVSEGKKKIVKQLIHQIISSKEGRKEALEIKNNEGNTPLHVALSKGNEAMCQLIAGLYPPLVGVGNANRETPIFLAVQDGKKEAFLKLLKGAIEGDTSGEEGKEGKEEKNGKDVAEESIRNFLFHMARKDKWDEVVKIYEWTPLAHKTKITNSGDTALHIAVSHDNKERVEELIKEIISNGEEGKEALKVKNEQGNTPLHVAASMGSVRMCECIAQVDPSLVAVRNKNGETPLFVTALYGQQKAFLCLLAACDTKDICEGSRRNDGDTILHVALAGDYFGEH
ncbi:ankyrin repeat-containing protein At5g02620-like [Corylus avellana]|uniref:ankyrin repeat-containing protein At5g02620-like n=1 Tax=Corylus avellana TaxID=13451 RepID=UPI00286A5A52|nr:ankyrin repeat-containing protein At5g02620-like [Corylus avellana]